MAPTQEPRRQDEASTRRDAAWRPRSFLGLFRAAAREWILDKAPKQAAALAYYALFALGPVLLLSMLLAGWVFGADAARGAVMDQLARVLGPEGAQAVDEMLGAASTPRAGIIGAIVGGVLLLFGAVGVFAQLKEALNRVWEIQHKTPVGWKAKLAAAVRRNVGGFSALLGIGFLLLVSLVVSAGLAAAGEKLQTLAPGAAILWQVVNVLVALFVVAILFMAMFKLLPDARVAWRDAAVGGAVTSVLFMLGQLAIGLYIGAGPISTKYGAAGAVLAILVWVYYSGLIVFYGAEFTQVFANRYGAKVRPSKRAEPIQTAVQKQHRPPSREGT
jgi:membrane protein